ncbi:pyrroloquinoline quinone biosynthesis peptide chaperone PqqD [Marinobacterium arenosum]|uniref:pyrroloquinoline quinone biosynthesis peptide chaperone PqqD n=1 Tax=Marinobacterium arenosum TaxID=2862496 RepID=UPI001C960E60|nr:pyrroloquinoline quinone biosynthesis peptide chaperone PqqD [Marinobacterium arenosum]MBY4677619.1 pyrroloquinoline quinone biosynthesis peptide chaperone PqqD [Marinobacterium arenosum]
MIDQASVPSLNPMFRLQWEPAQQAHVLLYPEGMVRLNGPAGEILARVDGQRPVERIIAELALKFPEAEGIDGDILEFLAEAAQQNWVQL